MPLNDTIASLATDFGCVVTRAAGGTWTDGIYVRDSAPTTFTIDCVVEPAFNLNRVIGGANLYGGVEGQMVTDVRQFWTITELKTRTPDNDPDEILLQGKNWTVARVERWDLDGEVHFHCVVTAKTMGASS
jgi:hypothetical protein